MTNGFIYIDVPQPIIWTKGYYPKVGKRPHVIQGLLMQGNDTPFSDANRLYYLRKVLLMSGNEYHRPTIKDHHPQEHSFNFTVSIGHL